MSFLNELCMKKNHLKPTTTIVTQLDGKKFKEIDSTTKESVASAQYGFVVDTKPDNVPLNIIDNVYLGSQDCCELSVLETYKIRFVLSVGIEAPTKYNEIVYKFVPCLDLPETDLDKVLIDCIDFIHLANATNDNVLVHCNAGVSRAPSIVIGFLILSHNYTFQDAYNFVKSKRCCIRPNDGFLKQLKTMEKR